MSGVGEAVALVGVDDQLRGDVEVAQGMPELEGLRGWTFAVAIANQRKCRGAGLLDEGDGGAFGVDCRVIVNGGAEVRAYP